MSAADEEELCEPDDPAAWALARHIADYPVSTLQAAFRYLNSRLIIELHENPDLPKPEPGLRGRGTAASIDDTYDMPQRDDLREQIRRACAEADGFRLEDVEPHDYQPQADAILALFDTGTELREQYAVALKGAAFVSFVADDDHRAMREATGEELADAVFAVRDAEMASLRARIAELEGRSSEQEAREA